MIKVSIVRMWESTTQDFTVAESVNGRLYAYDDLYDKWIPCGYNSDTTRGSSAFAENMVFIHVSKTLLKANNIPVRKA